MIGIPYTYSGCPLFGYHMKRILLCLAAAAMAQGAHASPVTTNSFVNAATYGFDAIAQPFTAGPETFAIGSNTGTYTSDYSNSVYGYDNGYGLDVNGNWFGLGGYVGINSDSGTVRFDFANAVAAVGGYFNYAPFSYGDAILRIYGAGNTLVEVFNLTTDAPISTPYATNGGEFRGFQRDQADIFAFTISGAYAVVDDLTIGGTTDVSPVPLPATAPLLMAALGGLGLMARRRKAA